MDELLQKVKDNLILAHDKDDELLRGYIRAAVSYAERYQHIPSGHYADNPMPVSYTHLRPGAASETEK